MAKKVTAGLIGTAVAIGWLCTAFLSFPIFALLLAVVSALSMFELNKAFGVTNKAVIAVSMLFAFAAPMLTNYPQIIASIPVFTVFVLYFLFLLLASVVGHENLPFNRIACVGFSSIWIGTGYATVIATRNLYNTPEGLFDAKSYSVFFLLLAFFCSWLTDAGAYFAGSFLGKHKMCPKISPHKTTEGAVGGVIVNAILCVILLVVFRKFFDVKVGYVFTVLISILLSVVSIFGDLAASCIKRQSGIKDFGNVIPGHGGFMDRFDSSLFVFPLMYTVIYTLNELNGSEWIFH